MNHTFLLNDYNHTNPSQSPPIGGNDEFDIENTSRLNLCSEKIYTTSSIWISLDSWAIIPLESIKKDSWLHLYSLSTQKNSLNNTTSSIVI